MLADTQRLMKIYTIKEIAKMSGVSVGTVDRVLHNRGKVSEEKEKRVKEILKKIDYKPNQLARSLKMNKRCRFAVLMPDDAEDEYWSPCWDGINQLITGFEQGGHLVQVYKYSPSRPADFVAKSRESLEFLPDGVLLAAFYMKESKEYLKILQEKGIPFNLMNTVIEGADYATFVGQDLVMSGRTAAQLFEMTTPDIRSLLIVHFEEELENAFHMQQKEKGFKSYFADKGADVDIRIANIRKGDPDGMTGQLKAAGGHDVQGIFVTTSKSYLLIESGVFAGVPVIGYDLLKKNVQYLHEGRIRFLIYQNPRLQAYRALTLLSDLVVRSEDVPKERLLPIEIVTTENVGSYLL